MKNFIKSILSVVVITNLMVIGSLLLSVLCEYVDWIDKLTHFRVYELEINVGGGRWVYSGFTIGAFILLYVSVLIYGLLLMLWNKKLKKVFKKLVNKITNR